jgi:hypothetical protein
MEVFHGKYDEDIAIGKLILIDNGNNPIVLAKEFHNMYPLSIAEAFCLALIASGDIDLCRELKY